MTGVIKMNCRFTVVIQQEEEWYVAQCIENGIASQGKTIEDSMVNLKEAIELYYEDKKLETAVSPAFLTTMEVAI
jgi:predicted RNase H-like HicB family nuclease